MKKNSLILSAFFLTASGIISRIIGFFYKIYLSNIIGARNLGVYSLIFTVYGICNTIYASGIQTALSKLVAERNIKGGLTSAFKMLIAGCIISFSLAAVLMLIVFINSSFIACRLLNEPDCELPLKILSIVFPFCAITSCINGYYYGLKKASVPAASQLVEQLIRVFAVMAIVSLLNISNDKTACCIATAGVVIGEIGSQIFSFVSVINHKHRHFFVKPNKSDLSCVAKTAFPLTLGRLSVTILHSAEAVLIPILLRKYGYISSKALSVLGVLNGMTLPFILFPSALTGALSILMLPTVSEAKADDNDEKVKSTGMTGIKLSLITGIFSAGCFIFFGDALGTLVFKEPLCGTYLTILAWLCPFLYVSQTFGSILNGLGKLNITLINSVATQLLKLVLIYFLVPVYGMEGYFTAFLVSQIIVTIVDLILVIHYAKIIPDVTDCLIKPVFILIPLCLFFKEIHTLLTSGKLFATGTFFLNNPLVITGIVIVTFFVVYFAMLIYTGVLKIKDIKM